MKNVKQVSWIFLALLIALAHSSPLMAQNLCRNATRPQHSPRPQLLKRTVDQRTLDQAEFLNYTGYESLLVLSDGGLFKWHEPIGLSREATFYATDYEPSKAASVALDNTKLPFRPNSFDFIFMNRGICQCCPRSVSNVLCGGITGEKRSMKDFILSISDILKTEQKGSLGLFTGYSFPQDGQTEMLWIEALQEVAVSLPNVEFGILTRERQMTFVGFYVASQGTPVQKKIKQLSEFNPL